MEAQREPRMQSHEYLKSSDVEQQLLRKYPELPALVEAIARRKRLLKAAAAWRKSVITQKELADRTQTTQPAVARLELGKVDPKLSTLERYAAAAGGQFIWQIVDGNGEPVSKDFEWEADVAYRESYPQIEHAVQAGPEVAPAEPQADEVPLIHQPAEANPVAIAVAQSRGSEDAVAMVTLAMEQSQLFAFARADSESAAPGEPAEVALLHYTVDAGDGRQVVKLPVFTSAETMRPALEQNPEWAGLVVFMLRGGQLVQNIEPDVTVLIDPWSDGAFEIPAREPGSQTYEAEPLAAAGELVPA